MDLTWSTKPYSSTSVKELVPSIKGNSKQAPSIKGNSKLVPSIKGKPKVHYKGS